MQHHVDTHVDPWQQGKEPLTPASSGPRCRGGPATGPEGPGREASSEARGDGDDADRRRRRIPARPRRRHPPGEGRAALDGEQVAVFRLRDGSLRAVSAVCPHRGGPIADGQIDDRVVLCPLHLNAFNLATGECLTVRRTRCGPSSSPSTTACSSSPSPEGTLMATQTPTTTTHPETARRPLDRRLASRGPRLLERQGPGDRRPQPALLGALRAHRLLRLEPVVRHRAVPRPRVRDRRGGQVPPDGAPHRGRPLSGCPTPFALAVFGAATGPSSVP